jgi:hypothetical protein
MGWTEIVTMPLSRGRDWLWYKDLNILALAPHLDAEGRQRAVDEMQAEWREALMPAVRDAAA